MQAVMHRPMRPLALLLILVGATLTGCLGPGEPAPGTNDTGDGTNVTPDPGAGGDPVVKTPADDSERICHSTLDENVTAKTPYWVLETNMGTMRIALFCDKAPLTGQHFVQLTEQGYFDGTKFHRVIRDFMNQGGDPLTKDDSRQSDWGTGGPTDEQGREIRIKDEFYCADGSISYEHPAQCPDGRLGLKHDTPGVLSMANTGRPATGGSQFFLTAVPTPHLDGKHAVFGHTADKESLDVALAINKVPTDSQDRPTTPVVIERATIAWS